MPSSSLLRARAPALALAGAPAAGCAPHRGQREPAGAGAALHCGRRFARAAAAQVVSMFWVCGVAGGAGLAECAEDVTLQQRLKALQKEEAKAAKLAEKAAEAERKAAAQSILDAVAAEEDSAELEAEDTDGAAASPATPTRPPAATSADSSKMLR